MPLYYGNTQVKELYYNNTKVKEMYYNNTLVYKASILDGTLAVGNTVTFDNKSWIVVHNDGNKWYLGLSTISYLMQPKNEKTIINACSSWLDNFSDDAKDLMVDVTINYPKYTSKVFIPTYVQVYAGSSSTDVFSYYKNGAANRKCQYNGTYTSWFTCTIDDDGYIEYITSSGSATLGTTLDKLGFRPHICITN